MADITIDGTAISDVTIDGTPVQEVTIDGTTVWTRITIMEDFEGGSNTFNGGSVVSSQSLEGTYSLTAPQYGSTAGTISGDHETVRGNTYKTYMSPRADESAWVLWDIQDNSSLSANFENCYFFVLEPRYNDIRLGKRVNGSSNTIAEDTAPGTIDGTDVWELTIDHGSSTITVDVRNVTADTYLSSVSGSDTEFNGGWIGAYGGSGSSARFDYWRRV